VRRATGGTVQHQQSVSQVYCGVVEQHLAATMRLVTDSIDISFLTSRWPWRTRLQWAWELGPGSVQLSRGTACLCEEPCVLLRVVRRSRPCRRPLQRKRAMCATLHTRHTCRSSLPTTMHATCAARVHNGGGSKVTFAFISRTGVRALRQSTRDKRPEPSCGGMPPILLHQGRSVRPLQ
jgi:hypothetical protein